MRVTIDITLTDDATDDAVTELLGAIAAQVEDDVTGVVVHHDMHADHPAWCDD